MRRDIIRQDQYGRLLATCARNRVSTVKDESPGWCGTSWSEICDHSIVMSAALDEFGPQPLMLFS